MNLHKGHRVTVPNPHSQSVIFHACGHLTWLSELVVCGVLCAASLKGKPTVYKQEPVVIGKCL